MTSRALVFAVRGRVVAKYVGELCIPLALATLLPVAVALAAGSWWAASTLGAVVVGTGLVGWRASRMPEVEDIQTNEAMVVVTLTFVLAATLMVPAFISYGLSPVDAFFEAVSGVTTTGLTVVPAVSRAPWDLLVIRSWLQWYGGLGFVTLSVLLVTRSGRVARRLDLEEGDPSDLAGHTRTHGRRVLLTYSVLTLAGIVLLLATGLPVLDATVHTFSSVSTGGFSTRDTSLAELTSWSRAGVTLLFVLGALPVLLVHGMARGSWKPAFRDRQLLGLFAMGVAASVLLVLFTSGSDGSWITRVGDAFLMGFSAQTTTGFSTADPGRWSSAAQMVLMTSMFVGGCSGSTAGGIKIWRALVALRLTHYRVVATALPEHAVRKPEFGGEKVDPEETTGILILILLFMGVVAVSWLAFLVAGHPPLDSLFDVVSATGTVGLSTGITGPDLSAGLKSVLCLDMLMGRLEILALLVLVTPGTWFGRRSSAS